MRKSEYLDPTPRNQMRDAFLSLAATSGIRTNMDAVLVDRVLHATSRVFGFGVDAIIGQRRTDELCQARHAALLTIWKLGLNMSQIARYLKRDPGTVRHSVHVAMDLSDVDPAYASKLAQITAVLDDAPAALNEPHKCPSCGFEMPANH